MSDTQSIADAAVAKSIATIGGGDLIREAVAAAGQLAKVELVELTDPRDGTKALGYIGPKGIDVLDPGNFGQYRAQPLHRTGTATHTRLDSFIAHVLRFKADHSAVFAKEDPAAPSLTAIFDYHPEGPDNINALSRRHKAAYAFPLSEEWKAWIAADGKKMGMGDFAAFLEDRIVDIVSDAQPSSDAAKDFMAKTGGNLASASKLVEISRGLQINEASTLRDARNLSTGEAELVFTSQHLDQNGAKLVLPNLFMIAIPVFARSPVYYQVLARFRYRKSGEGIVFWYELWRVDLVFEAAFAEACEQVKAETGLPLFIGAAEA
ncbi:MAG TPA: DUF2303 family protein [Novosphingobium sp.]|nr:DUF2303 family protein [Novosphingobium sp.]